MRGIKFRAWDSTRNIMYRVREIKKMHLRNFNNWDLRLENEKNNDIIVCGTFLKLMQFTGIKDKNGKDIYEGDIVKTQNIKGIKKSSKGVWKVIWNKYSTGFDGELISKEEDDTGEEFECLGNFRDYNVEVIGNIYENPELCDVLHAEGEQ